MVEIDQDVVPLLEAERACTFVGAEAQKRFRRDDVPPARLTPRYSLELAQLLERIDADVRVRADADADATRADALDRQEAVTEIRLRRQASADTRARALEQIE